MFTRVAECHYVLKVRNDLGGDDLPATASDKVRCVQAVRATLSDRPDSVPSANAARLAIPLHQATSAHREAVRSGSH